MRRFTAGLMLGLSALILIGATTKYFPEVAGNTISDVEQYYALAILDEIAFKPDETWMQLYVSTSGNDSNDGLSMDNPILSLDEVGDRITERKGKVWVWLAAGETWDTLAEWGGCVGTAVDDDCGFGFIGDDGSGAFSGTVCADTDEPCIVISGINPTNPPILDCSTVGATDIYDGDGVFSVHQASEGGWTVVQNIVVDGSCGTDLISVKGNGGRLLALNVKGTGDGMSTITGSPNNICTTHDQAELICINVWGENDSSVPILAAVGTSKITFINSSEGRVSTTHTSNGQNIIYVEEASSLSMIGGEVLYSSSGASCCSSRLFRVNANSSGTATMNVARLRFNLSSANANLAGLVIDPASGETAIWRGWELAGNVDGDFVELGGLTLAGPATINCIDCILDGVGNTTLDFANEDDTFVSATWRALVDDDDVTNTFRVNGTFYEQVSTAVWPSGWSMTLTDVDSTQWVATSEFTDSGSSDAWDGGSGSYNFPLAATIPKWVLDTMNDITQLKLDSEHYGL